MKCFLCGSFTPDNFVMKIELSVADESGKFKTREREEFKRLAVFYGMAPDDLGKVFDFRGHRYEITGLRPKSRKYPIVACRADGKGFKFDVDTIKRYLKKESE